MLSEINKEITSPSLKFFLTSDIRRNIEGCPILSTRLQSYPFAFHWKTETIIYFSIIFKLSCMLVMKLAKLNAIPFQDVLGHPCKKKNYG